MKFLHRLPLALLSLILLAGWSPLPAQTTDDSDSETPAPVGSTVITSDELLSDQQNHISTFTGKVVVLGNQFRLTCQEMKVYFTNDNKVDHLVATGDVVITQPDRITHCGHAEYYRDADTFVLTDQPVILDHKDEVHGTKITIDRTTQKMTVDGGRTKVIISDDSMGASKEKESPPSNENK
jgi:lipopolysaccharide transport protein LptA